MDKFFLEKISKETRLNVLNIIAEARSSHIGSALSIVDILTFLYFKELDIDPLKPYKNVRDIFILSKGHGVAALYSILAQRGYYDTKRLYEYYSDGGKMPGHPVFRSVPGIESSTGSLGQGLAIGLGQAIALKKKKYYSKVFVLMGDGECNEGSVWEAAMVAAHMNMDNIIAIVDCNRLQGLGETKDINGMDPIKIKWESFGWYAIECDGHDFLDLEQAFTFAKNSHTKPTVILANTVKGKGISFMENKLEWHYKSPDENQFKNALKELKL